jgi:hypothetical protein
MPPAPDRRINVEEHLGVLGERRRIDSCVPQFAPVSLCFYERHGLLPGGTAFRSDPCVLQLASQNIVDSQMREIAFQSQNLHDPGVNAHRNSWIALLDLGERPPRDSGALRDGISGVFSSKPSELEVLAKASKKARDSWKQGWDPFPHNKNYYTHKVGILSIFIPVM